MERLQTALEDEKKKVADAEPPKAPPAQARVLRKASPPPMHESGKGKSKEWAGAEDWDDSVYLGFGARCTVKLSPLSSNAFKIGFFFAVSVGRSVVSVRSNQVSKSNQVVNIFSA